MPAFQVTENMDIVAAGLRALGRGKMTDLSRPYQKYVGLNQIIKAQKKDAEGGYGLQWDILQKDSGGAKHVGAYNEDVFNQVDGLIQAKADYRRTTNNYIWDEADPIFNAGPEQILNWLKVKRQQCFNATDKLIEDAIWRKPANSTDNVTPWGLPYSIVPNNNATGANDGFEGYNPSGFAAGAFGVDATTVTAHANQVALYVNPVIGELDEAFKKMAYKMDFESPMTSGDEIPDFKDGPPDREIYTTYEGRAQLERMVLTANDNVGRDVAFYFNKGQFLGNPIIAVPALETAYLDWDTPGGNPVYTPYILVNWQNIHPVVMDGWWYKESGPRDTPKGHLIKANFLDFIWNFVNYNRREAGGIIYKKAA